MKMTNALEYKIHEIIARIRELRTIEGMSEAEMPATMTARPSLRRACN